MTQRYAHLAPENLREAIRVLDEKGVTIFTTVKDSQEKTNDISP
jgi:hypothetical protein